MPHRLTTSAPLLAILALAACGGGAASGPPLTEGFDELDRDGDEVVDQAEFTAAFDRFDGDGDGRISADENPAIVYEADGDRDGFVDREEFGRIDLARLEADADFDGRISRAELERYDRLNARELRPLRQGQTSFGEIRPENRWINFRF